MPITNGITEAEAAVLLLEIPADALSKTREVENLRLGARGSCLRTSTLAVHFRPGAISYMDLEIGGRIPDNLETPNPFSLPGSVEFKEVFSEGFPRVLEAKEIFRRG